MRVCTVILGLVCGPCICVYLSFAACICPARLRGHRCVPEDKRRFERRQRNAPRPLVQRKRALTIPLSVASNSEKSQITADQSQSRLLSLPLELREAIYKEVLGKAVFHIVRKEKKLGHLRCKALHPYMCPVPYNWAQPAQACCWGNVDRDGIWAGNGQSPEDPTDGDILPFLRTCRQIYSEAIPILYTINTFSFIDLDCIRHLSATILPCRLDAIKSIDIQWSLTWPFYDHVAQRILVETVLYPPHDEATWEEIWRIIKGMKGLKRVNVSIMYADNFSADIEVKMLAPLRQVMGVEDFIVRIPWPGEEVRNAPFRIIRPEVLLDDDSS